MRYLDQERERGVEIVRFDLTGARSDRCEGAVAFGNYPISLRDHHMAIVGLAIEGDAGPSAEVRIIRGCMRQMQVACEALPRLDDAQAEPSDGSPWEWQRRPSPWPTYIWNPVRQSLSFEAIRFQGPAALHVHWERLDPWPP